MSFYRKCRGELFHLGRMSAPLCAIYAADIGMYLVDMAVVGRLGLPELAGVAMAEQFVFLMIAVLNAMLSMFVVGISTAFGRCHSTEAVRLLFQGVVMTLASGVLAMVVVWKLEWLFVSLGFDAAIAGHAGAYSRAVVWCIVPYLLFLLFRGFLAAVDAAHEVLPVVLLAVIINVPLSYGFTFGKLGLPQLGVAGAGVSTSLVTLMMLVCLLPSVFRWINLNGHSLRGVRVFAGWKECSRTLRKGVQASLASILEDGLFLAIGMVVATLGALPLAVHYLANSIANVAIVFANGVGDAASIRVAFERGRGRVSALRSIGCGALIFAIAPIALISAAMSLFPDRLAGLFTGVEYTHTDEWPQLVSSVFTLVAICQIIEGAQVVAVRALRGLEDTLVPLLVSLVGYWLITLPLAWVLSHPLGLGIQGVWLSAIAGLAFVGVVLVRRFLLLTRVSVLSGP